MNDWYFYQERGKTVGPFPVDEIKGRIKDGQLQVHDLIYKDGEASWRMALEHPTLRSEFNATTLASLKERPWICLKRRAEHSMDFLTSGPYSQQEIRAAILSGKMSYSDYAWKNSFSEWRRIGSLEEFNPRLPVSNLPPVPSVGQETSADLLKNVVERTRPIPVTEVPPPPEAIQGTPPPLPLSKVKVTEPAPKPKVKKKKRVMIDWSLVGVLILLLAGVVVIVSRFAQPFSPPPQPVAMPPPPPPAPAPPVVEKVQPNVVAEPAKVDPIVPEGSDEAPSENPTAQTQGSRKPHELYLSVHAGAVPQIDVRSDGTKEYPVYLQIIGFAGSVSEGGAFYRYIRLTPTGDSHQRLEVPAIKLPQGKFLLRAESGSLKKESKFAWGLNEPQYKQTIARQRKMWAHALWKERLALFRLSLALEKQVTQALVPTKKFSSKGWEPLVALKRSNGANYLLFDEWWELHSIVKEAKTGVSGALATRAQKARERLATFSVWK